MKIAIILPTRGHPRRCAAILTALDHLSSDRHDIAYHLIVDDGDSPHDARLPARTEMHDRVWTHAGHPAVSHFVRINQLVAGLDADAVSWFADDVFPLAMHWDELIAIGIGARRMPAFAWNEITDPANVTYPVLSRDWIKALGYVFPEYFPFWFADTWIQEVHDLAFGQPFPVVQNLPVGGRRGATKGMHDLEFWFRFFDATHVERERDALRLSDTFGLRIDPGQFAAICERHHERSREQLLRVPQYEQAFGAGLDPISDRYRILKGEAEAWLAWKAASTANIVPVMEGLGYG